MGKKRVILVCTEVGLLIHQEDSELKTFDTTAIHARVAASMALEE